MELTALRKRLSLTPHDALSFGAPDRTGWANVEIVDTLSGDFRVVGQVRGDAFRPMGASQATMHLGPPDRQAARQEAAAADAHFEQWATFVVAPPLVLLAFALVRWHTGAPHPFLLWSVRTGMLHSIAYLAVALTWLVVTFTFVTKQIAPAIVGETPAPRRSPAETMASEDFSMATINCPDCGAPVSDDACHFCGWVRPL